MQKLNRRQAWWSLFLSQFDVKLVHVPGSQMIQSDVLSRCADYIIGEDTDNKNMTMLPDTLFVKAIDIKLHDLITENIMGDDLVKDAIRAIKENGTLPMKSAISDWKFEDSLLFFQDQCYVPQNNQL
jgi:hypothetical protein